MSILSRTSLPLGPCLSPSGFAPILPRLPSGFSICCIGTSITVGTATTGLNSYRQNLYNLSVAAGLSMVFKGKFTSGTPGGAPWTPEFGVVGSTLPDHMLPNTSTPNNPAPTADTPTWLAGLAPSDRPDILVHELGINDSSAGPTTTNFGLNMTTYIGQLEAIQPFRHVWSLPPRRGDTLSNVNLTTIANTIIATTATLRSGGVKILYADSRMLQGQDLLQSPQYESGVASYVHPNDIGDIFKATQMFTGILLASGRQATWASDWNG